MSPEQQQPNSENANAELAFVHKLSQPPTGPNAPPASSLRARHPRRGGVCLDAHAHVPARKPWRAPALTASRRPVLSRPPVRDHHVPSSGDEQEYPHHPSGARQHAPALIR